MRSRDLQVVHTASSFTEAQLLVGLLESEGIAARAGGSELMDEFSAARRLLGPTEVMVQAADAALAADVVAAWLAHRVEDPPSDGPSSPADP